MKKSFKSLALLIVMLFAVITLFACGGPSEDELVGTWLWEDGSEWIYTFNADGTGVRGNSGAITFEWSIVRGNLHIETPIAIFDDAISEIWDVTIEDDVLTLDSSQLGRTYSYIRQ